MTRILLRQRSPEWLAWRRQGIGGSDAPIIMGAHADEAGWPTVEELLAEKLGTFQREETFAMRRGRKLEPTILARLEAHTGMLFRPACMVHPETPWLRASLDGITFWGNVVAEMKAPNVVQHEVALGGVCPRMYFPQVQHVLMVSDAEVCLYVSYSLAEKFAGDSLAVVEVRANAEYQAALVEKEAAFWDKVCAARQAGAA